MTMLNTPEILDDYNMFFLGKLHMARMNIIPGARLSVKGTSRKMNFIHCS